MKIPRWVSVVALLSSAAFLFGCGMAGSGSSTSSGKGGPTITTAALPDATVSQTYSGTLQAAGGTSPYSWSVVGGTLPTGISLTTSGQIAGTPTDMGDYTFQAQVTDAAKKSSSSNLHLKVTGPPPSIYNISPTSGSTSGGTSVTINGKNLQAGAGVSFGGVGGTSVNVVNSGQMTAVTPAHAAGAVDVVVTNPGGKSASLTGGFTYTSSSAGPTISGITPGNGPTAGGTSVTISGTNLQSGATVTFGGIAGTSVNVVNSGEMTAVTPAHSAGYVDVVVTNPNGQTATLSNGFGYSDIAPSVTGISPNSGPTSGGTAVTITGSNFAGGALVSFGTVAATGVNVTSATQIQATTPSVSTAAAVDVVVKNSDGQSGTLTNGFTYTDSPSNSAPTVTDVSPSTATDGSSVNVDGTNFASGATVKVGSTAASNVKFVSSTQLSMTVPNVSAGTYDVTVTNSNGLSATLSAGLTVTDPQSLLSGCTVDGNNKPSCATPAGWTSVVADGFDNGQLANSSNEQLHAAQIECTLAHSGGCAVGANYASNGNSYRWILNPGAIGNSHEIYVSWWEYVEPTATMNWEMFLVNTLQNTASNPQSDVLDWFGAPDNCTSGTGPGGTYNCLNGQILIEPGSNASGGVNAAYYQGYLDLNLGGWRQYEYHFKANTPGSSDGQAELYVNGQLVGSWSNKNFNGNADMTGMDVEVGGTYTAGAMVDNATSPTTCYAYGSGQGVVRWCSPFSNCSPCPIPPNFHRYWDDIIVLKR